MKDKWKAAQRKAVRDGLLDKKTKLRALADKIETKLTEIKQPTQRNGQQWAKAEREELLVSTRTEARKILEEALPALDKVSGQSIYFSREYRAMHERLVPLRAPKFKHPLLSEQTERERAYQDMLTIIAEGQDEIAEDLRRTRVYTDLLTADPEEFATILNHAVDTSNHALLGLARKAAKARSYTSDREKAKFMSAVIKAESEITLPEEEQEAQAEIEEMALLGHQIQSTAEAIRFDRQDIARKVEETRERAIAEGRDPEATV